MNPFIRTTALALALATAGAAMAITPPPVDEVELTGWLQVDDYSFDLTTVEVEVDGTVLFAPVSRTGRFSLVLPANTEALLRFEHPGHLPKEVTVDTRNAHVGGFARSRRHVSFAVVLDPERRMAGQVYAGPVASIAFDPQGGAVQVLHSKQVVPARHNKAIVF